MALPKDLQSRNNFNPYVYFYCIRICPNANYFVKTDRVEVLVPRGLRSIDQRFVVRRRLTHLTAKNPNDLIPEFPNKIPHYPDTISPSIQLIPETQLNDADALEDALDYLEMERNFFCSTLHPDDFVSPNDSHVIAEYFTGEDMLRYYTEDLVEFDHRQSNMPPYIGSKGNIFHMYPPYYAQCIIRMDGYFLSYLMLTLKSSTKYAKLFFVYHGTRFKFLHFSDKNRHFFKYGPHAYLSIFINLKPPMKHYLDILGNYIANQVALEKHNLESALSWLSTLGGAFSALGDLSQNWALAAGEISLKQFRIALKLNDPLIGSRCRIYVALSLIQRGYLTRARNIVKNEYNFAKSLPLGMDSRLHRMCLGVWSKLQYEWKKKKLYK